MSKSKVNKKYDSLAQFVFYTRENLGLSVSGLSKKCNLNEDLITAIESGVELFLPTTVRQKLARGLKVSLNEIKIYETTNNFELISNEVAENLRQQILDNRNNKDYSAFCPICGSKLSVRVAKLYDLEDNLVLHPKAFCTKCPFQLHS